MLAFLCIPGSPQASALLVPCFIYTALFLLPCSTPVPALLFHALTTQPVPVFPLYSHCMLFSSCFCQLPKLCVPHFAVLDFFAFSCSSCWSLSTPCLPQTLQTMLIPIHSTPESSVFLHGAWTVCCSSVLADAQPEASHSCESAALGKREHIWHIMVTLRRPFWGWRGCGYQ